VFSIFTAYIMIVLVVRVVWIWICRLQTRNSQYGVSPLSRRRTATAD